MFRRLDAVFNLSDYQNRVVNGVLGSGGGGGGGDGPSASVGVRSDKTSPCGGVAVATPSPSPPQSPHQPAPVPPPDPKALSALRHAEAGVQALGVLVNYLVYNSLRLKLASMRRNMFYKNKEQDTTEIGTCNLPPFCSSVLDAFSAPKVKNDLEKMKSDWLKTKLELEEAQASYNRLEDTLNGEKLFHDQKLKEAYENYKSEQSRAEVKHQLEIDNLTIKYNEKMNDLEYKFDEQGKELKKQYDIELEDLKIVYKTEIEALKTGHEIESTKLKEEKKIIGSNLENALAKGSELEKQIEHATAENEQLKQKIQLLAETINSDKDSKLKRISQLESEVSSLRCVLELRSAELQEQRRNTLAWQRDAERLPAALHKITTLKARLEDLQAQLHQKEALEQELLRENRLLAETVSQEAKQKKRLSLYNEELQWKLKQNAEVATALAALYQASETAVVTNAATGNSLRVQKSPKSAKKLTFNTKARRTSVDGDQNDSRVVTDQQSLLADVIGGSPPTSPKVKAIVEKSDSVAWVLDLDEPPEYIASRILRRAQSLRASNNSGTPPTTPTHRTRSSRSLSVSSPVKSAPETATAEEKRNENSESPQWDDSSNMDSDEEEEEHITEEVIMVENIGDKNVLEFLHMEDDSEIHIEAAPHEKTLGKSEEELRMIRRVGESEGREMALPKDSAGEAMVSEETSDDEEMVSEEEGGEGGINKRPRRQRITMEAKVLQRLHSPATAPLSDSSNTAIDLSWSEDAELLPSEG
ncbi:hypothetical protein AAG570_006544 [Ranatra chinensis]|uniref:Uncharacterized protein n=1 Tax=Ranatra chinensis TaxID=642074 RepID=A0ABD0YUD6_9HEMI